MVVRGAAAPCPEQAERRSKQQVVSETLGVRPRLLSTFQQLAVVALRALDQMGLCLERHPDQVEQELLTVFEQVRL